LAEQLGVQVKATSAGRMVTIDSCGSRVAAQVTWLLAPHVAPAWNDVGSTDATTAASRAAFVTVISA
jgi:hypothetical protein